MIASDVTFIMNGANHLTDAITTYPFSIFGGDWSGAMDGKEFPFKGNTIIGNDVWIGYGATIMPGVNIGDGCIIGSKSVVTKDVEPYSIVGGNPVKVIRKRYSDEEIASLLNIKWWDWPVEKITENLQVLTDNDVVRLKELDSDRK
ncbi:MAG: CatB-related O-acetyltransferase [Saprospiraceae bacterium]|nr:CatB-related O-acetyltransferase [Saprospiraceae bacterium]